MKASDITDKQIFAVIDTFPLLGEGEFQYRPWVMTWDFYEAFPDFPQKVIMAKLKQMVKKNRLQGCCCGCRGDFQRIDEV